MLMRRVISLIVCIKLASAAASRTFPENFEFGVASASYQIEGAWNVDGKGESIWDNFTHRSPSPIANDETGDMACLSYYKYKEDVALAAALGMKYYRFSIAWTRIFPTGYADSLNQIGLDYYKNLVQEIINHGMVPVATMFHWDLPQRLVDDGIDWTNVDFIQVFVSYAQIVIKNLPEVGFWVTINEPRQVCHYGYGSGQLAPGITSSGILEYQCTYVLLKTHAAVYHMYKDEFPEYTAKMFIAPDCQWTEPLTETTADIEAAHRFQQFECGIYLHPVFVGDWPDVVKSRIAERSKIENYDQSRLPAFTKEEIAYIKGTSDLIAFNHYLTFLASDIAEGPEDVTSYDNDARANTTLKPSDRTGSNGITVNPLGLRSVFNWLREQYGDHDVLITEIGLSDDGSTLIDDFRIDFYTDFFCTALDAIYEDNISLTGIISWSVIDNFEWTKGYNDHFGIYSVNFTDPERTRLAKKSVGFFQTLTSTRELTCSTTSKSSKMFMSVVYIFIALLITSFI